MPKQIRQFASRESLIVAIKSYLNNPKAVPKGKELGKQILLLLEEPEYKYCNISKLIDKVTITKWQLIDEADAKKVLMLSETNITKKKKLEAEQRELAKRAKFFSRVRKVLIDNRYFKEV